MSETPISKRAGYQSNEWYTPAWLADAARSVMGSIDLDPTSSPRANEVINAKAFYTAEQDGLTLPFYGNVWLNPPYSSPLCAQFIDRLCTFYGLGEVKRGIALVNNATETKWFQRLAYVSGLMCLFSSRIKFWRAEGKPVSPRQGQVAFYFGDGRDRFVQEFSVFGTIAAVLG